MAEKLIIEVDLESGDIKELEQDLGKKAEKAGENAGKKLGKGFNKESKSAFDQIAKNATAIIAGVAAVKALASSFNAVIDAAKIQEDAINNLNNALKTSGDFSEQASSNFQEFASQLQQVTRFGDEAILNQIAIAKSFGATNEQAKLILTAATDLSAALGISLDSAVRNVAKTLGGLSGELGESIPQLKELGAEALKSGEGIEFIAERFSGAAQRSVKGYSGSVDQASNAFGDLLEEIGAFITQNDSVIASVNLAAEGFNQFGKGLKVIRTEFLGISQNKPDSELEKINAQLTETGRRINDIIDRQKKLGDGFFDKILGFGSGQAEKLNKDLESVREERQKLLKQRAEIIEKEKEAARLRDQNNKKEVTSEKNKISNIQLFQQAQIQNEQLLLEQSNQRYNALEQLRQRDLISEQEFLLNKQLIEQEFMMQAQEIDRANRDQQLLNSTLTKEALINNLNDIQAATISSFRNMQASSNELGKTLANLGVKGFGTLGRNIGTALATGASLNEAFVSTVKQTASEAAEAFGEYYIKLGVARIANGDPGGGAVLSGGIALKALAGALTAGGSGDGGGGSGGAGSFNQAGFQEPFAQTENVAAPENIERAQEQTSLVLNIEGSLVREQELNGFIADILEEGANRNSTVIPSLRTSRA